MASLTSQKKISEFALTAILIAMTAISLGGFFWINRETYSSPYNHAFFSRIYTNSPYVQGLKATEGIGDDGLYAFAGYYYITGGDISQVNFENPPLGKYLIGLSILGFGNQNAINILYALAYLVTVYGLIFLLSQRHNVASIGMAVVAIDPFFRSQLALSLLDLPMALFFLVGLLFYVQATKKNSGFFWLSSLSFGLASVTKFFPGLSLMLVILCIDIVKNHPKKIKSFIYSLILLPLIYVIIHGNYFYYHPSIVEFLRYQKWILAWRLGNPVVPGNIAMSLFFGRYRAWWEGANWLVDKEWSPVIAIIISAGFLSVFMTTRRTHTFWLVSILAIVFFLYVFFGTVGLAKYILPVYPLFVFLGLTLAKEKIDNIFRKR